MTEQEEQNNGSEQQSTNSGAELAHELQQISPEQGERVRDSGFSIGIDKEKVRQAEDIPDGVKEWMTQLPEQIDFKDPVTLVVGENGQGKTVFARGVLVALGSANEGRRSMSLLLDKEGEPAAGIAGALEVQSQPEGNVIAKILEGAEVMSASRQWTQEQSRLSEDRRSGLHRRSSRELFDDSIAAIKKMRVDDHRNRVFEETGGKGHVAVVFDEPEQGLSPKGQLELADSLDKFLPKSDTLIVPTNNIVLYLSDLPRLDLEHPERGIFRPSEYGEGGTVELKSQKVDA